MTFFAFLFGCMLPGVVQFFGGRFRTSGIIFCLAFVSWHAGPIALLVHLYSGIDAVIQERAINDAAKTKPAEPKAQAAGKPKQQRQPKPAKRPIVILSARRRFRDE